MNSYHGLKSFQKFLIPKVTDFPDFSDFEKNRIFFGFSGKFRMVSVENF